MAEAVVLDSTGIHVIPEAAVRAVPPKRDSSGHAAVLDSKGLHTVLDAPPPTASGASGPGPAGTGEAVLGGVAGSAQPAKGAVAEAIRNLKAAESKGTAKAKPRVPAVEAPRGPGLDGPPGGSVLEEAAQHASSPLKVKPCS